MCRCVYVGIGMFGCVFVGIGMFGMCVCIGMCRCVCRHRHV